MDLYELRILPPFGPTRRVLVTDEGPKVVDLSGFEPGTEATVLVLKPGNMTLETRDYSAVEWRRGYPFKVKFPAEFRLVEN